jgi:hypothetical protein
MSNNTSFDEPEQPETHENSGEAPSEGELTNPSATYLYYKAAMDEQERWDNLTPRQKFDEIVETYPAEDWTTDEHLNVLAVFCRDGRLWLRALTIGRQIGVDTYKLDQAVKTIRDRHARWKLEQMRKAVLAQKEVA